MDNLFLIIAVVSFLAIAVFVLLSVISFVKKDGLKGKKMIKFSGISFASMIVFFILFAITTDSEEPTTEEKVLTVAPVVEKTDEEKAATEAKEAEEKANAEKLAAEKLATEKAAAEKLAAKQATSIDKANFEAIIVPRITGLSFVETIDIQENEVTIKYFEDFDTYIAANPKSNVDEEAYKLYWGSGDAIEKALFKGVSDLMDKEANMNKLNLSLPFDGKDYTYTVERSEVEKYIGGDEYDDTVRQEFIMKYIGEEITVDNI